MSRPSLRPWTLTLALIVAVGLAPTVFADAADTPRTVESLEAMLAESEPADCLAPPVVTPEPTLDPLVSPHDDAAGMAGTFWVCLVGGDSLCGGCGLGSTCSVLAEGTPTSCCIIGPLACVSDCIVGCQGCSSH